MSVSDLMKSDTPYVSPGKAAIRLQCNPRTVARWADEGLFGDVAFTAAGHRRISTEAVERVAAEMAARVAS